MNSSINNNIVRKYIEEEFIPHLYQAINHQIAQKNVVSNMPKIISEKMIITLLDSSVKNNSLSTNIISQIVQAQQKPYQKTQIKVPKKKNYRQSKYFANPQQSHAALINHYKISPSPQRAHSELIKLPNMQAQQDNEDRQIKQIVQLKKKMRKFTKDSQIRAQQNDKAHKRQRSFKKHALHDCIYHTYDYETNLIPVNESKLQNILSDSYQKSLLEIIKANLDSEIRQKNLQSRLKSKENIVQANKTKIQKKQIQKIQYTEQPKQSRQKEKKYRPFQFHLSNIDSLSKELDKNISSGVKMVTFQQKIIEQHSTTRDKKFTLLKKQVVKQKKKDKLDTQGSQSIIYSLQKKWDKEVEFDRKSYLNRNRQQMQKYYSIQYEDHRNQYDHYKSASSNINQKEFNSHLGIKLPQINFFNKKSVSNNQRILTEQKMIKRLSDVQIKIGNKSDIMSMEKDKDRSSIFSAFIQKKQTQSSLSQGQNKSSRNSKTKKQYVKDYFNNYAEQFRHKLVSKEDINSLYF